VRGIAPSSGGTFTRIEIVLCEPAFNGSTMADKSRLSPQAGARTALNWAIYQQAIEDMSE
jgi:hypothetical protein